MCCCCISLRAIITILIKIQVGICIFQQLCLPGWVFCLFWTTVLPVLRPLEGGCLSPWAYGPWCVDSLRSWQAWVVERRQPHHVHSWYPQYLHLVLSGSGAGSVTCFPAVSLPLEAENLDEHTDKADLPPGSTDVLRPPVPGTPGRSFQLKKEKGRGRPASTRSLWFSVRERQSGDR